MSDAIAAAGVIKRYGTTTAVRRLDWSVPRGSITALVGPNGAGKTTTVKLLLDLTRRNAGSLDVLGIDPAKSPIELRRRIGYVPEDKTGFDGLRVDELRRYVKSFFPTWSDTRFRKLLHNWSVEPNARLTAMSKGTRTKTFLALALAHDPELVVLDEPTDGLDPSAQDDVLRRLLEIAADGRTVLIVTHRLAEVESIADRLAVMNDGQLVVDGELENLRLSWRTVRARVGVPALELKSWREVRHAARAGEMTVIASDRADALVERLGAVGAEGISVDAMNLRELYLAATAGASAGGEP